MSIIAAKLSREASLKTRVVRIAIRAQSKLEAIRSSGWFSRGPLRRSDTLQHYATFIETDSSECRTFGDETGLTKI